MEQVGFEFQFPLRNSARHMSVDEIYDRMKQSIAVDIDENEKIERKNARYRAKELGNYFSMWANPLLTHGSTHSIHYRLYICHDLLSSLIRFFNVILTRATGPRPS